MQVFVKCCPVGLARRVNPTYAITGHRLVMRYGGGRFALQYAVPSVAKFQ